MKNNKLIYMNPIILTLIIIYLVIILTKNIFSNKDIAADMPNVIANIMLFIRKYLDDIFLVIFVMLGLIIYFAVLGINLNPERKVTIEDEVVVEKFKSDITPVKKNNVCDQNIDCGIMKEFNHCISHKCCGWASDSKLSNIPSDTDDVDGTCIRAHNNHPNGIKRPMYATNIPYLYSKNTDNSKIEVSKHLLADKKNNSGFTIDIDHYIHDGYLA